MNFRKLAALMLVIVLALCSVSALATTEEEYEARIAELEARIAELEHELAAKEYVAEFDGGFITVEEAMEQYDYISYMYSSYGYSIEGYENTIKQDILDTLVEETIVRKKAEELGMYDLTEEKEAELMAAAQEDLDGYIANYRSQFESEEVAEETIIQATTEFLAQNGITLDVLYEDHLEFYIYDEVYAYVCDPVTVSDEEVQAKFDELVNQDQIAYTAGTQAYEYALQSGTAVYWNPVGFRNVRQVLVAFDDDQSARYSEITSLIEDLNAEIDDAIEAAAAGAEETEEAAEATEEAAEATEETAEARDMQTIKAELEAAEADLAALYAELQPTVDEVYTKFEEGTSIDELIATYGGDPGSINDDGSTNTYTVAAASTGYDTAFRDAAMSIENIGELAEPANGMYGIYIIYYDSDVTPGAVPFETVKDDLYNLTLEETRTTVYDEQVDAWIEEMNVVTYIENFR